jgi:hypothetical protein
LIKAYEIDSNLLLDIIKKDYKLTKKIIEKDIDNCGKNYIVQLMRDIR